MIYANIPLRDKLRSVINGMYKSHQITASEKQIAVLIDLCVAEFQDKRPRLSSNIDTIFFVTQVLLKTVPEKIK